MFDLTFEKKCSIQYMSDLHLERVKYEFEIPRTAPTLILGGDIGRLCDFDQYVNFLKRQCRSFDRVLLVAGNHEFYGSTREEGLDAAQRISNDETLRNKLIFMHRTRVDIEEGRVIVLGCTLQSHIGSDCGRLTNDFSRIKNWSVQKHNAEHELDVQWLKQSLSETAASDSQARVIIVTHYAPAFERTCHPKNERSAASQCFSSDILHAFPDWTGSDQVTHWIFGHTHWNARFKCFDTTVVSNQRCNDSTDLNWLQKRTIYRKFDEKAKLQV